MGREGIDLRLELCGDYFDPGETIYGNLTLQSNHPVAFRSGILTWKTMENYQDPVSKKMTSTLLASTDQKLILIGDGTLSGSQILPIKYSLPENIPLTIAHPTQKEAGISTILVITIILGEPVNASIIHEYPITIGQAPKLAGIMQSIEFPIRACCVAETKAIAHIELLQTCFVPGDCLESTVVVDLTDALADVKAATVQLKRYIIWKDAESGSVNIDEFELGEGEKTVSIGAGRKTAVTVAATIPEGSFVPDVHTERVVVRHAALFLFYTSKYVVETEIPITLVAAA